MSIVAEKREKQYVSDNAQLMAEWDWQQNAELDPTQLTLGSNKKAWWSCSQGHKWEATPNNRSNGTGCPYCANRKVLIGYNDLQATNPTLAKEWNHKRNGGLKPEDFTSNSGKKVWWRCAEGHEWQSVIASRNRGVGCPYCSNRKIIEGYNDLQTVNPTLAKEWCYEKNGTLTPQNYTVGSSKKVWWKCAQGHEWQAKISNRAYGYGCPECAKQNRKKKDSQQKC